MTQLIISEKPSQALKIAQALSDEKSVKKTIDKVSYFEIQHKNKKIIVVSSVGHLFGLKPTQKGWIYPVFSFSWEPIFLIKRT